MQKLLHIASNWDIPKVKEIVSINNNAYKLICENKVEYFLKTRNNITQIKQEEELLEYLSANNIPVSVPIKTINDKLFSSENNSNYILYKYVSGNHLTYKSFNDYKKAVKLYGLILGRLHKALKGYKGRAEHIKDMNLSEQVFTWALPIIEKQEKHLKIKDAVLSIKREMIEAFEGLPKQFIHRDFHEENIIFNEDDELIGIIDFDICMIGYKIYDIVYILTSMLMNDVFNDEFKINWLKLPPIFIENYLLENKLEKRELNAIWYVALASQLTFIAYAIEHDNEKLLNENLEGFYWIYNNRDKAFHFNRMLKN